MSPRKAETIVPLGRGGEEATWVERARVETVRALAAEVRRALRDDETDEEPWERLDLSIRAEVRAKVDQALALAGKALGAATPKWRRVEALCQEYLGAHPPKAEAEVDGQVVDHACSGLPLEELKAWLEKESRCWDFIRSFDPAPDPESDSGALGGIPMPEAAESGPVVDLVRLDADLRRLRDLRAHRDDLLGHLAMLLRQLGLWRDMQFVSFGHYCAERLGMSERAVSQRVALERLLHELPALRAAMRDGRVSYEKARIVAAHASARTLDAWIDRAGRLTCIALAREAEAEEEAQTCARGELSWRLPVRNFSLLEAAIRAARAAAGRHLTPGEALELIAEHFIATWTPLLAERNTLRRRAQARDKGWCQVPGCSRAALHTHHVRFRSHLGPTVGENLTALCAAHHLHGVHAGYLRVTGLAPDRLRWTFRPGGGPLLGPAVGPAVVESPGLAAA